MSKSKPFTTSFTKSSHTWPTFILASTSPFRAKLLLDHGFVFETMGALGDELTITGGPPRELAARRAAFKAFDVGRRSSPGRLVLGADQVLSLGGIAFDKAPSVDEAFTRLMALQGKTHFLHSAICLVETLAGTDGRVIYEQVIDCPMSMHSLTTEVIESYLATDEWKGCVGCYRVEGEGRKLFSKVADDESAIIGLPISEVKLALKSCV